MPRVRCSRERCKARRTLARKLDDYVRIPKCRGCGGTRYRVDTYRRDVEMRRKPCTDWRCLLHFPHRKGSRFCIHHPNFDADNGQVWDEAMARNERALNRT